MTGRLDFEEFLSLVMRLRGSHSASVTDITDLREYTRQRLGKMDTDLQLIKQGLRENGCHIPFGKNEKTTKTNGTADEKTALPIPSAADGGIARAPSKKS